MKNGSTAERMKNKFTAINYEKKSGLTAALFSFGLFPFSVTISETIQGATLPR
jgi:hypothetical protein